VSGYFLDTSALAELYHQEDGSQYVERLVTVRESSVVISRLSLVEMESVLAIKVRTGELDAAGRELGRRRLRADLAQGRIRVGPPIDERHYRKARDLIHSYGVARGLRTLDAIQLAVAYRTPRVGSCFRFRCSGSAALRGSGRLRFLDGRSYEPRDFHSLITLARADRGERPTTT
jgi:predicted nucleic acid-binding protein